MNSILDEIIEYLPQAKRYNRSVWGCCVFHTDSTPSLAVYPDTYRCLGCGKWGKTTDLLQTLKYGDYPTQPVTQSTPTNLWGKDYEPFTFARYAYNMLRSHPQQSLDLRNRGITEDTIKKLMIGMTNGHYIFPVMNKYREVLGNVARTDSILQKHTGNRYKVPYKQSPELLYIPDHSTVENSDYLIVVFGIIDAITLMQMDYPVITHTIGKDIPAHLLETYRKPIFIIPDEREERSGIKLAQSLGWRGKVILLQYPDGTKDCNDIFVKYGENTLREMIDTALEKIDNHVFVMGA